MAKKLSRMSKKIIMYFAVICLFFFLKCQPAAISEGMEFQRIRLSDLPGTSSAFVGEAQTEYYIAAGDVMEIFIWRNPDLTRDVTVRPDGRLSYPLIGTIEAAGLTIDQLQNEVTEKLSHYIRSPQVTISVKESTGNTFSKMDEFLCHSTTSPHHLRPKPMMPW